MGAVEDLRKVLQDFLAPELRALTERMNGMEKNLTDGINGVEKNLSGVEKNLNDKIEHLEREMNRRFDYIESSFRLDERVGRLEESERKRHPKEQ